MAYLGNAPVVGDSTNSFKLLDDIQSFTVTFDATDAAVVSIANNTLTFRNHRFVTAQKVTYNDGGGTAIGGLADGSYFIIKEDQNTIKLASSASNAAAGTAIDLTSGAAGGSHTLKIAFDGINTKFKATHSNGTKAKISRAAQLSLSINGVIQQPQDTTSPTVGYGIEADSTIVFSTPPSSVDKVFGSFIGEVAASFDIEDNTIDNFTGNGSTTIFNLSKEVPSSQDVLVTLDGVTQHPSDGSTTRSYSVIDQALTFVSAPADGVAIQARHIGFAGASTSAVTGFYGRTGNAALISTDDISVNDITVAGDGTVTGGLTVGGNLNVTGDITYDETVARNLNITGIATVASGIVSTGDFKIGTATTLSQDNIFTTGIITATSFVGSGANLTGVASTENIRTNTNATFLQNVTVVGTSTVTGNVVPSSDSATDIGTNSVRFQNAYVDTYYGDGSNLTGISAGTSLSGSTDNTVCTVTGANAIQGETGLTYNGTRLEVKTGDLAVTGAEGGDAQLRLTADEGDDGADYWRLESKASNNKFNLASYVSGAWVDKCTVTTDGDFGLGTSSPVSILHLHEAGASGSPIIQFSNGDTGTTTGDGFAIGLADNESPFIYNRENTDLRFATNNSERMRILAGGGLTFNGDTAAANALDDYEEGSWTPSLNVGTVSVADGGTYRKIGKIVHLTVLLSSWSNTSSSSSILISGVPFNSNGQNVGTVWLRRTTSGGKGWICTIGDSGNNIINIQRHSDGNDMGQALRYSDFANSSPYMNITITYQTSS